MNRESLLEGLCKLLVGCNKIMYLHTQELFPPLFDSVCRMFHQKEDYVHVLVIRAVQKHSPQT